MIHGRHTSSACKIGWHGDSDVEVLGLCLGKAVDSRDVVGDSQVLRNDASVTCTQSVLFMDQYIPVALTSHINIANIWTSSIRVHLMNGNRHQCASLDFGNSSRSQGILGVLPNIDISCQFCPTTLVDDVRSNLGISNDGGVLLARTDTRAVSCNGRVD